MVGKDLRTNTTSFFSFGDNSCSQLGLGNSKSLSQYNTPQIVMGKFKCHDGAIFLADDIQIINGGSKHSIVVLNNGKIFSWGSNAVGQLGHGETFEALNEPKQVLALKHQVVVQAACGDLHTAATTDAGDIWTWGRGLEGQLGHGYVGGKCLYKPQHIDSLELANTRFALVACGRYHTVISSTDGIVYSFGSNSMGQLSTNDPSVVKRASPAAVEWDKSINLSTVEVAEISVGAHHTVIRDTMGIVYSCGWSGFNGRLGHTTSERIDSLREVTVYREDALNEDQCWRREFLDRMLDTDLRKTRVEPDWIFPIHSNHVQNGNLISQEKVDDVDANFSRTNTGNFLCELQRVFRAINIGMSGELLEIEVRRILFRMHISTWGLGIRKVLNYTDEGIGSMDEWDFINFLVQKFESNRLRKRYFAPPYKLYKWIIDEYDQLQPKAAVMSLHVKTFIRIFSRNCANLNAEIDKELIRKMFEYEINPKAEEERLAALEKIGKGSSQAISNMRGIERLDSIANHPLRPPSRELHALLESDGRQASPQTNQRLQNAYNDGSQSIRPSTPMQRIAKEVSNMEDAVIKIKRRKPLQPELRKGIVDWSNLGLNDRHIEALSLSLKELPILRMINLRNNVISDDGIDKLHDVIEWQYLLSEYDMHTTQCIGCNNDVYFESRSRHTAFCTRCNRSNWRPVYYLSKVEAKEERILGMYEMFKWSQSEFDKDSSKQVADFLNERDNPVSVQEFRDFFDDILSVHIEKFREHCNRLCKSIKKPKIMTRKYKRKVESIRNDTEKLVLELIEFADNTFQTKHLPRYRIVSLSELQKASNNIRKWLIDSTFEFFHNNLPLTDDALLQKIQELHVEAVSRMRTQSWEFNRMINVTIKVLYAIAKHLYEHYVVLKKKISVASISCGYSDSLTISNSGLVYSFGNSSGIIEAFKEQIVYNLPDRFRHSIENDRAQNKNIANEDGETTALFGARKWESYDETNSESSVSSYTQSPRSDLGSLSSRSSYTSYISDKSPRSNKGRDGVSKEDFGTDHIETPRQSPHNQSLKHSTPQTIIVKPKVHGKNALAIDEIKTFQSNDTNAHSSIESMRNQVQGWKDEVNDSIENSIGGASLLRAQKQLAQRKLDKQAKMKEDLLNLNREVVRLQEKDALRREERARQQRRLEARLTRERHAKARIADIGSTGKNGGGKSRYDEVNYDPYYVDEEEAKYGTVEDLLVQFKVLDKAMVLGLWEGMEHDYKRVKVALLHIVEAKVEVDAARKRRVF